MKQEDATHYPPKTTWALGATAALALVCGIIYFTLLLPGVGYHPDTIKYQFIGKVLGLSHPPGSPLYILINFLAAQIPVGELAWRINALSALFMAINAGLIGMLLHHFRLPAFFPPAGALLFGLSPLVLEQALIAEVYAPHLTFLLAGLILLLRWHRSGSWSSFTAGMILYGLSFAIHTMSIFAAPGIALLVASRRPSPFLRLRGWLIMAAGAVIGFLPYLYYPIRSYQNPVYHEGLVRELQTFIYFITGGWFKDRIFAYSPAEMAGERLAWLGDSLVWAVGIAPLLLAVAGFALIVRRSWAPAVMLASTAVFSCIYAMGYKVGDDEVFLIPAVSLLTVLAAIGGGLTVDEIGKRLPDNKSWRRGLTVVLLALVLSPLLSAPNHVRLLDKSSDREWQRVSKTLIDAVEPGSLIISSDQWWATPLAYQLWGAELRKDADILLRGIPRKDCDALRAEILAHPSRRPVYLTGDLGACIVELELNAERIDISQTMMDYLRSLPEAALVLLVINDEGTAGLKPEDWKELKNLGILSDFKQKYRWSYAGAFIKRNDVFTGAELLDEEGVRLHIPLDSTLAGSTLPFEIELISGGALSQNRASVLIDGEQFALPNRGMQIVVFDSISGAPIDRKVIDTHKTVSLLDRYYFKLRDPQF